MNKNKYRNSLDSFRKLFMMRCLYILIMLGVPVIRILAQSSISEKELKDLYERKQYVTLESSNNRNSKNYFFYKAVYYNVSNNPNLSIQYLDSLEMQGIPADITYEYWGLKSDNYVKLFDYKNAATSTGYLIEHFNDRFKGDEKESALNSLRIWEVLAPEEPQVIGKFNPTILPFTRDLAGLINIKVLANQTEADFVFDTGAGISCVTESQAEKFGIRILPDNMIEVKGYNGISNRVRMGIASSVQMGNIVIENALFLVFKDDALTFANGAYKINGIIGFPIAKDLGTITIGKETIGFETTTIDIPLNEKNLFIELLTPILLLKYNGEVLPFGFDTGADKSSFSKPFYKKYKTILKKSGKQAIMQEASAGGASTYRGLKLEVLNFNLGEQNIKFPDALVNMDDNHILGEKLFGNIGQDLLKQYSTIVISFDHNYLKLIK